MIHSRLCNLQYIWETKRRLKERLMNIDDQYATVLVIFLAITIPTPSN